MITIPFQVSATEYSVYIGLGDDNIERVRQYDPAEVVLSQLGEPFQRLKLKDIVVGYCSEDDFKKVQEIYHAEPTNAGMKKALRYLTRGYKFRPEFGDHDGPPLSIKIDPKEPTQ
jgi:hypothetical protein